MKKLITKFIKALGFDLVKREGHKNELHQYRIPKNEWAYIGKVIYLKEIDMMVADKSDLNKLGYYYAKKIYQSLNGRFRITDDKDLQLLLGDFIFTLNDPEELFIINEVFIEQHYNLSVGKEFIVIDIGQNVGITSLFFASDPLVKKVYGFELFPETFKLGQVNITGNKHLSGKIISYPYGLGTKNEELDLEYAAHAKGRMGMYLNTPDIKINKRTAHVTVRDVYPELKMILEKEKDTFFVCKIDCEGAEYDILQRLFDTGLIKSIDSYLVEWHYKDPGYLIKQFHAFGFQVLKTTFAVNVSGMLYAFKNN